MEQKIKLGKKYKDRVTGFEGVAVARTEYMEGCARVCLEKLNKNGEVLDAWFDEPRILTITKGKAKPGGPHQIAPPRLTPTR